jgi:hypothetical protein
MLKLKNEQIKRVKRSLKVSLFFISKTTLINLLALTYRRQPLCGF